ncbi:MAG: lipid A deacylase LpxR family protein, partial [Sphingobacteriaceae bacterium]|nr:lipid A deacylase LpxR family protein [Sphingobacteriaceae bacterium]
IEIITENDTYLLNFQDKYYTNGFFLTYRKAIPQIEENTKKRIIEFSIGQKMFNPYSGQAPLSKYHDRPFAGYLYVGSSYKIFFKNENMLHTEAQIGVIGKNSLAQTIQEFMHKLSKSYSISGWEYQIQNSVSFNTSIHHLQLIYRTDNEVLDFISDNEINLGTSFTNAQLGVSIRMGRINSLNHSAFAQARIDANEKNKIPKNEFYFYVKPKINLIAYDETIQGSLFNNDSPVTFKPKPIVLSQEMGLNYSARKITIDASLIFKTKELNSLALPHKYGSIRLFYRF